MELNLQGFQQDNKDYRMIPGFHGHNIENFLQDNLTKLENGTFGLYVIRYCGYSVLNLSVIIS